MRSEPLGDSAYVLRDLQGPAYAIADALNGFEVPGLIEAAASYDSVGVYVDPARFRIADVEAALAEFNARETAVCRRHSIPVCFEMGEDLSASATALGLSEAELVRLFCGQTLRCYAIGFCPGFPYLGYLDERLRGLSRLPSPRVRVPKGSVAIAENQAGIYPMDHAGGWRILGRTPLHIVNVEEDYFPISAGDEVLFTPISRDDFKKLEGQRL